MKNGKIWIIPDWGMVNCINEIVVRGMVIYELYFKIWRILMVDCINGAVLWGMVRS